MCFSKFKFSVEYLKIGCSAIPAWLVTLCFKANFSWSKPQILIFLNLLKNITKIDPLKTEYSLI